MIRFLLILLTFFSVTLFNVPAFAVSGTTSLPTPDDVRFLLNRTAYGANTRLGEYVIDKKIQLAKGTFRFAASGGASVLLPSTLLAKLKDVDGKDLILPNKALVKQVVIEAKTAAAASASTGYTAPFLALGVNSNNDLKDWTAAASFTGYVAGTQTGGVGTMSKTLGNSAVTINMKGGSIIAGDLNVFIEYYLSD